MNYKVVEILSIDFAVLDEEAKIIERQSRPAEDSSRVLKMNGEFIENEWQMEYRLIYSSYKMDYA